MNYDGFNIIEPRKMSQIVLAHNVEIITHHSSLCTDYVAVCLSLKYRIIGFNVRDRAAVFCPSLPDPL
jgi:hypothetical protein